MNPRCSIIILNWNGWQDTIECLCSLNNQYPKDFDIILIDNNSQDESVDKITQWAEHPYYPEETIYSNYLTQSFVENIELVKINENEEVQVLSSEAGLRIYLISNSDNVGFAKASNQGIQFALEQLNSTYFFLLNNDTFVHPEAISRLIKAAEENPDISIFQSAIYHYSDSKKVWHVGGTILPWIQTRYFKKVGKQKFGKTESISGCALFLSKSTIEQIGYLSEQFFHGEEDLNYSLRILKEGLNAVVVNDSLIYHKVSASSKKQWGQRAERIINASLNRILNAKTFFPPVKWYIWRVATVAYYWVLMVVKYRQNPYNSTKLLKNIYQYSSHITQVDKTVIQSVMGELE